MNTTIHSVQKSLFVDLTSDDILAGVRNMKSVLDLIQVLRIAADKLRPENLDQVREFMGDSATPDHHAFLAAIAAFHEAEMAFRQKESVPLGSRRLPDDWLFPDPDFEPKR